ncbi:MAG: YbhB/YbcL family Raf kinase inhibitor-like protein [Acidobacteriia bacterium]|nr:YbhB/YbcL family Raf kinase inhibitor-like protein [Terriglobia bacterium]
MSRICNKVVLSSLVVVLGLAAATLFPARPGVGPAGDFKLTSSAFPAETTIPKKYSCDGQDISPPLAWSGSPTGTKSFALIMDDPDARPDTWVHWVLYDLPATARDLPENVPKQKELASGARNGVNGEPKIGYEGPCPPPGPVHHYHFKLYALDGKLGLKPGATKADVEKAMQGHILGEAHLVGLFKR